MRSQLLRTVRPQRFFSTSPTVFSGHNKWSTIKHDKAKNDAEKNKIANKFSAAIAVAAREGGPDPLKNVQLATTIEAANKANVLKRVIENAIKRGAGIGDNKKQVEQRVFEGVGPGGVAFIVEALTDNNNRTVGEVRACFNKYGGSLSPTLFNFDRKGYVVCELPKGEEDEDKIFDLVISCEGEDYEIYPSEEEPSRDKNGQLVEPPKLLEVVTGASTTGAAATLLKEHFKIKEVGIAYFPKPDLGVKVADEEIKIRLDKLKAALDDVMDVTDVYTNEVD